MVAPLPRGSALPSGPAADAEVAGVEAIDDEEDLPPLPDLPSSKASKRKAGASPAGEDCSTAGALVDTTGANGEGKASVGVGFALERLRAKAKGDAVPPTAAAAPGLRAISIEELREKLASERKKAAEAEARAVAAEKAQEEKDKDRDKDRNRAGRRSSHRLLDDLAARKDRKGGKKSKRADPSDSQDKPGIRR